MADLRCGPRTASGGTGSSAQSYVTVGDADTLALLLGHAPSSAAVRTLAAGGAVALRSDLAPDGRATLDWFTPKQLNGDTAAEQPRRVTRLAAVVDLPVNPVPDSLRRHPGDGGPPRAPARRRRRCCSRSAARRRSRSSIRRTPRSAALVELARHAPG